MPALNIGPILYGAARGVEDAQKGNREEEAFNTDQQVRKAQLANEEKLGPLRVRQAQLGVNQQEDEAARRPRLQAMQDQTTQINLETAQLTNEERRKANAELDEARTKQKTLRNGLSQFQMSSDPQHVVDAVREVYPDTAGNSNAIRNADGSITLVDGDGQEVHTFKGRKWEDGRQMSPDDEFTYYVYNAMDPVKSFEKKWEHAMKSDIEGQKTDRAVTTASIRATAAESRAENERTRRVTSDVRLGESILDKNLRTTSIPGHFQNVYSSEDDAKLSRIMRERAGALIRKDDMEPEKAANTAIDEVRTGFATAKKESLDAAKELQAKKIDPRDAAAVAAEAKAGNPHAKKLIGAVGRMRSAYGDDVARYLFDQLPSKKK